jgi:hypothetical protein
MRFSTGLENPGLKPILRNETRFRWTEVQLPPAEAGGSHQTRGRETCGLFRPHVDTLALQILWWRESEFTSIVVERVGMGKRLRR